MLSMIRPATLRSAAVVCLLASTHASAQLRARDAAPGEAMPPEENGPPERAPVRMPELTTFVEAAYPPEALAQKLEADVVLGLTIDPEGRVTAADVVEPAGHGFDEAARDAALRFRFTPAMRGNTPVAVRILYKYTFRLEEEEPAVAAPARELPSAGEFDGRLLIADTGAPMAGAELTVTGPDGFERKLVTDAEGAWSLRDLAPGQYTVQASLPGYVPLRNAERVVAGEAVEVTYRAIPATEQLEVTVRGEPPPREVTRRTLEREQLRLIPGTGGDPLVGLQSLPGVARSPGLSALLIVRGSSPQDTLVEVDGAETPLIYHFGAFRSVIPTELLDRIDFYPGNFSSRYGRASGGIVDVGLRRPDAQCRRWGKPTDQEGCYHGVAQLDLIDGRLFLQGPLAKRWRFALGARRSWLDAWLGPVLKLADAGVSTAPVYYDWQAIAEHESQRGSKLSLRFYGTDDRVKVLIEEPPDQFPSLGGEIDFGTSFWRAQALYTTELAPGFESVTMLSAGRTRLGFLLGDIEFDLDVYPVQARHEFGWTVARGVKLDVGLDFLTSPARFAARGPRPPVPGEPNPGPFSTLPVIEVRDDAVVFQPAWYGEAELQPTRRLRIVPGFRADFVTYASTADYSPRINARYDLIAQGDALSRPGRLRTTLKGGAGLFHKPPAPQYANDVFGTPGIGSERAIHTALGIEQQFTDRLVLSTEGFYKDLSRLITAVRTTEGTEYKNQGTGSVIGLETLFELKPGNGTFGWVAYTLSRSARRNAPGEPEYLFQFDETHNLTALGSYELGRGWTFGARFRLISGRMYTPVIRPPNLPALYASDASSYTALRDEPFSERLPLVHQLDLRIEKAWQYEWWRLLVYLDVYNAYNHASVEGVRHNYNFSERFYSGGTPIIPSLGVQGEL
jgi:TonB family protein